MNIVKRVIKNKLNKQYGHSAIIENADTHGRNVYVVGDEETHILLKKLQETSYSAVRIGCKNVENYSFQAGFYGFINVIALKGNMGKRQEQFLDLYKICQIESNYYIDNKISGKIVNIVRAFNVEDTEAYYSKCMTEGLGRALGNHAIVVNGMLVSNSVCFETEAIWAVYLLSKYGAIMSGQVVTLGTTKENLDYNFPQTF